MFNIFKIIERNKKSLLQPNCWAIQTWGLMERKGIISNLLYYFFLFGLIYFVPSQYIELWHLRNDRDRALQNLSYSLLSTITYIKCVTFIIWKKKWKKIIDYVSDTELNLKTERDTIILNEIKKYFRYSQAITYLYWGLAFCTVLTVIFAPLLAGFLPSQSRHRILSGLDPYPEVISSWVPFDKSRGPGYYATILLQSSICVWGGGLVGTYDSTAFALMVFFNGQFKILKIKCERIFEGGTNESALERIKDCYKQHANLIKHCNILNSLLSPVLFLYVIICSIMICAAATILTSESAGFMQQIWFVEYLTALISQLFLYCWHSNDVYYSSQGVEYAVFSSTWYEGDLRLRQNVLLLNGKLRKSIVFTAGPFSTLDVTTFIAILKGSYSYYTLLK